jgi:hypothetical protein
MVEPLRHLDAEATEPAISEVELDLAAQRAFRADGEHVADDEHPNHQHRIDRRSSGMRIVWRQPGPNPRQIKNASNGAHQVILRFHIPLIGRVEDWRAGLGRCSCSQQLVRHFVCDDRDGAAPGFIANHPVERVLDCARLQKAQEPHRRVQAAAPRLVSKVDPHDPIGRLTRMTLGKFFVVGLVVLLGGTIKPAHAQFPYPIPPPPRRGKNQPPPRGDPSTPSLLHRPRCQPEDARRHTSSPGTRLLTCNAFVR